MFRFMYLLCLKINGVKNLYSTRYIWRRLIFWSLTYLLTSYFIHFLSGTVSHTGHFLSSAWDGVKSIKEALNNCYNMREPCCWGPLILSFSFVSIKHRQMTEQLDFGKKFTITGVTFISKAHLKKVFSKWG